MSTPVADSVYMNIYLKNSSDCAENDDTSELRYLIDVKSVGFRFHLEFSPVSSHTEKVVIQRHSLSVYDDIYIYIYIYIYINLHFPLPI